MLKVISFYKHKLCMLTYSSAVVTANWEFYPHFIDFLISFTVHPYLINISSSTFHPCFVGQLNLQGQQSDDDDDEEEEEEEDSEGAGCCFVPGWVLGKCRVSVGAYFITQLTRWCCD